MVPFSSMCTLHTEGSACVYLRWRSQGKKEDFIVANQLHRTQAIIPIKNNIVQISQTVLVDSENRHLGLEIDVISA